MASYEAEAALDKEDFTTKTPEQLRTTRSMLRRDIGRTLYPFDHLHFSSRYHLRYRVLQIFSHNGLLRTSCQRWRFHPSPAISSSGQYSSQTLRVLLKRVILIRFNDWPIFVSVYHQKYKIVSPNLCTIQTCTPSTSRAWICIWQSVHGGSCSLLQFPVDAPKCAVQNRAISQRNSSSIRQTLYQVHRH